MKEIIWDSKKNDYIEHDADDTKKRVREALRLLENASVSATDRNTKRLIDLARNELRRIK